MAILSKTGITTGQTVETWHVTQSIDAFTGVEAYDISLSGSFNMTGSINGESGVVNDLTASYALTASYTENAATFPYTGSALITGSLGVTGSFDSTGSFSASGPNVDLRGTSTLSINSPSITIDNNGNQSSINFNGIFTDNSVINVNTGTEVDFGDAGALSGTGFFRIPTERTSNALPKAGMMYWDDANSLLYIYSETNATWMSASFF